MAIRIALATCRNLPTWERDDAPLREAFEKRGAAVSQPVWDDPAVRWSAFDCVLIRTTWDYTAKVEEYVQWVECAGRQTVLIHSPTVVKWNIRKTYLRELAEQEVAIADTVWIGQGEGVNVAEVMERKGWEKGFLKPVVGASAKGTMRFGLKNAELAAAEVHAKELAQRGGGMLQEYISTVEDAGEYSAIFIAGELTHSVRKVPVKGDYRVQDDHGGKDERADLSADEQATAKRILRLVETKFGENEIVYARVDFHREAYTGRMLLTELELVEPSLFFRHGRHAAEQLAEAVIKNVQGTQNPRPGNQVPQ